MNLSSRARCTNRLPQALLAGALCLLILPASANAYVYWGNWATQTIGRANLDGTSGNESFISGVAGPCGVAVDGSHIYWANLEAGTIGRANLDGSSVNQSFISGATAPCGIAVDGSHVYWANRGANTIGRANLDGSSVEQAFISGANFPCGVAVDGSHVYWGNEFGGTIGRANLDGSSVDEELIQAPKPCVGTLDASHIYWINTTPGTIGRASLDGSSPEESFVVGIDASDVAVDSSHLYWANPNAGTIGRSNLAGSTLERNFISGAHEPFFLAVDPYPLPTRTDVYCTLGPVRLLRTERCTATVTDTVSGENSPTGDVTVSSGSSGAFNPAASCGLAATSPEQASCQLTSTSTATASEAIEARYSGDVMHASSIGTTSSFEPSNSFRLLRVRRNRRKGTAMLVVTVPGPGRLSISGKSIANRARNTTSAGQLRLPVSLRGRADKRLTMSGTISVVVKITYTPSDGLRGAVIKRLILKKAQ